LQPLDSNKFPTIDWPYLDAVKLDGTTVRVRLFDYATQTGGTYSKAEAQVVVGSSAGAAVAFDRVTIWFLNFAFDLIAVGGETPAAVAASLAAQINGTNFGLGDAIEAEASGNTLTIRAKKPGRDGNMIRLYTQSKTATLTLSPGDVQLAGGSSDATWRVNLDFTALGLDQVRQMWLTFAPPVADAGPFADTEFVATFTNWAVAGANRALRVAGVGSVRVEETDAWCSYSGAWGVESGFYSKGFSRRSETTGDAVTVFYSCQATHDLYVGTSLYVDRGRLGVSLDGDAETLHDCYLLNEPQVNTRRLVRSGVPAGEHRVVFTVRAKNAASSGNFVYFDFLEAVVAGDVPDALPARNVSPAMDYGTDHAYKPPPARLMWWMDQLGFAGDLNVYVSVFWWNQRKLAGRVTPQATVDFAGTWAAGDAAFVQVADAVFGKTVFPADGAASIAKHMANYINAISVGVWARADGSALTLTARAAGNAFEFAVDAWRETPPSAARTPLPVTGGLEGGVYGLWMVDPAQSPTINRGAREWLADLLAECSTRNREIVLVYSMELLNPPDDPAGGQVWASRYPDGEPVLTATGFATNATTHCAFTAPMLAYQKRVYADTADLMAAAGVPVILQVGEFLHWFFNNMSPPTANPQGAPGKGMAFYDEETKARAVAALGRPLHVFTWPEDSPGVNGYADADFLRELLDGHIRAIRDHVRALHPGAEIEILLPYDVNYPVQAGVFDLGGQLNFYINVPPSFLDPATAPFDRVKMEALDWQVGTRSTDLSRETMRFPYAVGSWPKSKVRFLIGLFNGGACWERAYLDTVGEGLACVNFWAADHIHLFGWDVTEPVERGGAQIT